MSGDSAPFNLTNHFLIAMPGLEDALFSKSVVYVCEHNSKGALGLVINKPADMDLKALFEKIDLPMQRSDLQGHRVFQGGPVQTERGFVLHEATEVSGADDTKASLYASTMTIPGGLEMTTSKDVLEAIASGSGPRKVLVSLGYSAWAGVNLRPNWVKTAGSRWMPTRPSFLIRRSSSVTTRHWPCWACRPG